MSPRIVILVPWRTDHGPREVLHRLVRAQIDTLGLDVFEADSDTSVFSIARAWNVAARAAGDWDVAIQWGADILLEDPQSALAAAARCTPDTPFVKAFNHTTILNNVETNAVIAGHPAPIRNDTIAYSGPRATHRTAWDRLGWYDERFIGWGHEDRAFKHGIRIHYGHANDTVDGRAILLWHPRANKDPYWTLREANRILYEGSIEVLRTPAEWAAYVKERASAG